MKEGVVRAADALQSPWLIGAFFLMLVLLAWCNVTDPLRLRQMIRTAVMVRPPKQTFREEFHLYDRLVLPLLAMAVLSISVFLYQFGVVIGRLAPEQTTLLRIVVATILMVIASVALLRAIGWCSNSEQGILQYIYHGILQLILLGLLLLPLSLMLTFAPLPRDLLIFVGLILVGAVVLLRWFRGVSLGLSAGIPVIYIVLYLCAAEILPALIGLRMLGISPVV